MKLTSRRILAVAIAAVSVTVALGAAPASAASATVVRPAACDYNNAITLAQASQTHGNETRIIQLRYSTSSKCVWARELNGQVGDYMWVWNENTGAQASAYINSGNNNYTGAINDNGTKSHACMVPVYDKSIKVCTTFQ
jgi:hypothetical protein